MILASRRGVIRLDDEEDYAQDELEGRAALVATATDFPWYSRGFEVRRQAAAFESGSKLPRFKGVDLLAD